MRPRWQAIIETGRANAKFAALASGVEQAGQGAEDEADAREVSDPQRAGAVHNSVQQRVVRTWQW